MTERHIENGLFKEELSEKKNSRYSKPPQIGGSEHRPRRWATRASLEILDTAHAVEHRPVVVGHSTGAPPHFGGEMVGESDVGGRNGVLQHGGGGGPEIPGLAFVLIEVACFALVEVPPGAAGVESGFSSHAE